MNWKYMRSQLKHSNKNKTHLPRKVFIYIDKSYKKLHGKFKQKSSIINPRNFLQKDHDLLDYDLDSEIEF